MTRGPTLAGSIGSGGSTTETFTATIAKTEFCYLFPVALPTMTLKYKIAAYKVSLERMQVLDCL